LRNAQLVEGVLDVLRDILPVRRVAVRRADVVVDVVEVDRLQELGATGPRRVLLLQERAIRIEAELEHPLGLPLHLRHLADDVLVQALLGDEQRLLIVVEAPLVLANSISRSWIDRGHDAATCSTTPSSRRSGS